ncbi:MAG: MoaD/ThiS family protein [Actinomycetaceae bacterium]|nr:MoaD/ThiS family protein [Actinomycetaceae bacterium]
MDIYYYGAARAAAGTAHESVDQEADTLASLLEDLCSTHTGTTGAGTSFAEVMNICTFLGDGARLDMDTSLADIERIDVMPPFAGG